MPKLINLPIEEARALKWRAGREKYGPVFVGDPIEQLDEELLDAMNYAAQAGLAQTEIAADLLGLCVRVRALYDGGAVALGSSLASQNARVS